MASVELAPAAAITRNVNVSAGSIVTVLVLVHAFAEATSTEQVSAVLAPFLRSMKSSVPVRPG